MIHATCRTTLWSKTAFPQPCMVFVAHHCAAAAPPFAMLSSLGSMPFFSCLLVNLVAKLQTWQLEWIHRTPRHHHSATTYILEALRDQRVIIVAARLVATTSLHVLAAGQGPAMTVPPQPLRSDCVNTLDIPQIVGLHFC